MVPTVQKPELLVPLNGWKSLAPSTGVLENADAVYFGIEGTFSMRARAQNFTIKDLPKLLRLLHEHEIRAYLTTNILLYNSDLEAVKQVLTQAKQAGVDAVICHDMAVILMCQELEIPFHISTQANISNVLSAKYYESLGAERLILARELSLREIADIISTIHIPVEVFVHGAMCTAVSGRCYFSAEVMGFNREFSANRGKCVQPCRRNYTLIGEEHEGIEHDPTSGLFFNAKDLCMIAHIPQLIQAGIAAFKIEGRMRDPEYIGTTARLYQQAIHAAMKNTFTPTLAQQWEHELTNVFNRGFHTGFYFTSPTPTEINREHRGNQARQKRSMIGRVINYYRKAEAVEIRLMAGSLALRDTLVFENETDFYLKQPITSLRIDNHPVDKTPIAKKDANLIIGMHVENPVPINARVFLLTSLKITHEEN